MTKVKVGAQLVPRVAAFHRRCQSVDRPPNVAVIYLEHAERSEVGLQPRLRSAKIPWVDEWAECDLAWELADTLGPLLPEHDRVAIYATIGSGDSYAAITTLVQASAHSGYALPLRLVDRLAEWLDAYTHSNDAARLLQLLNAIRTCSAQNRSSGRQGTGDIDE